MVTSFTQDKIEKIHYWLGLLLIFWLPLDSNYIPALSTFWILTGALTLRRNYFNTSKLRWNYVLLFFVFYLLHVISVLYSSDTGVAWFDLEIKLPLLFFPLLSALLLIKGNNKRRENLLLAFVVGNFVAILICLGFALWGHDYLASSNFQYTELSYFHHPSYFAMYLAFALAILLFYFLPRYQKKGQGNGIGVILFLSFVLAGFIILLSSRAGILALFIVVLLKIIHFISYLEIKTYLKYGIFFLMLGILVFVASKNQRVQKGVDNFKTIVSAENPDSDLNSMHVRYIIWKSGIKILQNHGIIGVGNGDVKNRLMSKADELYGQDVDLKHHYNAHNQFLDSFLALGIPGLLVLLLLIFWPGVYAIKKGQYLLLSLALILFVSLFFESMVNRQAGVVFFAFFLPLMFGDKPQNNKLS